MRLIISAGGTGGHIYPALAIIQKFQELDKNTEVLYIGTHNRMENKIVPEHNIPFVPIKIYGFSKNIIKDFKNCAYVIKAYYKCIDIMKDFKPDVVIGVGGYVTLPVIMAAKKLKIKTFIHEQNSIPGKTNKFLCRGVDGVFTSFKDSEKYFRGAKCYFTGNPCSDNVSSLKGASKKSLGLTTNKKLVLVVSGSLGSKGMNEKLEEFLNLSQDQNYEVLFITGESGYSAYQNKKFPSNVKVIPYLDNLSPFLKSCDLVISRSGAGIIAEILASKVPSILIPSPNVANNHQYYNAASLEKENLALLIEEKDLDSRKLSEKIKSLLNDSKEYQNIKNNLNSYKQISSSKAIYDIVKEATRNAK